MIAKIQIPDNLELGKIYKGSIYLTANGEGSFRKYNIADRKSVKKCFRKLSHGKVSWSKENIRLNIHIDRTETDINPNCIISNDVAEATKINFEIEED